MLNHALAARSILLSKSHDLPSEIFKEAELFVTMVAFRRLMVSVIPVGSTNHEISDRLRFAPIDRTATGPSVRVLLRFALFELGPTRTKHSLVLLLLVASFGAEHEL